jgi:hypothetical protein
MSKRVLAVERASFLRANEGTGVGGQIIGADGTRAVIVALRLPQNCRSGREIGDENRCLLFGERSP